MFIKCVNVPKFFFIGVLGGLGFLQKGLVVIVLRLILRKGKTFLFDLLFVLRKIFNQLDWKQYLA